ncbi:hypothetical protein BGW38_008655, partial [Lunasporangiospora selenospora]
MGPGNEAGEESVGMQQQQQQQQQEQQQHQQQSPPQLLNNHHRRVSLERLQSVTDKDRSTEAMAAEVKEEEEDARVPSWVIFLLLSSRSSQELESRGLR